MGKIQELVSVPGDWCEATVVCFLVEVRKLIDHQRAAGNVDLAHLRFCCDWIVHISKDRIDPATITILRSLQEAATADVSEIEQAEFPEQEDLLHFGSFRRELCEFLPGYGIGDERFQDSTDWPEFRSVLVRVLVNQPLNVSPSYRLNITRLTFLSSVAGRYKLLVEFRNPIQHGDGDLVPSLTFDGPYALHRQSNAEADA